MPRAAEEVFRHHARALGAGDPDEIVGVRDGLIRVQTVRYTLQHKS
jgi:hypothetical protein